MCHYLNIIAAEAFYAFTRVTVTMNLLKKSLVYFCCLGFQRQPQKHGVLRHAAYSRRTGDGEACVWVGSNDMHPADNHLFLVMFSSQTEAEVLVCYQHPNIAAPSADLIQGMFANAGAYCSILGPAQLPHASP